MRFVALICATSAALLSLWAAIAVADTAIFNRTDREGLIGAFFVLCLATPFALIAAALSLKNRRSYPRW